jgi:hypothetical protein
MDVMKAIAEYLGPGVKNKVVIDASNPLSAYPNLECIWDKTSGWSMHFMDREGTILSNSS